MTTLTKRKLGSSGLDIAPLVFGGNVFGWTADEATSFALLDGFVEADLRGIASSSLLSLRVGRFKTPVGYESLRSSSDLRFAERAFPTALSPRRDLGAMLAYEAPQAPYSDPE